VAMSEQGNSAHNYRLDDGKFRLTFISASPSGAQFLSENGDFTRWELGEWLKDGHMHPSTDFEALLDSFEKKVKSTVPLVRGDRDAYPFRRRGRSLGSLTSQNRRCVSVDGRVPAEILR